MRGHGKGRRAPAGAIDYIGRATPMAHDQTETSMKNLIHLLCPALLLAGCAPPGTDALPEAVRSVATRAASSTTDRLLVVAETFGDTAMSFATRQALITAGVVVQDASAAMDSAFAMLEFVSAEEFENGWRVRTTRTTGGGSSALESLASEQRVEWVVTCAATECEVTDSTTW